MRTASYMRAVVKVRTTHPTGLKSFVTLVSLVVKNAVPGRQLVRVKFSSM